MIAQRPISSPKRYRFGPFEADLLKGELRKNGARVRLQPKPWQLLLILLENCGKVLTRERLQHELWGDEVFVDFEHGLNVAVRKLRTALSDSPERPQYIETLAREGYRFIGELKELPVESPDASIASPVPDQPANTAHQQTATPPSRFFTPSRWAYLAAMVIAAAAAIGSHVVGGDPPPAPAEHKLVLVGAFVDHSGDATLGSTMQFALEHELKASRFVRIVPPERVQDLLKLMRRSPEATLDRSLLLAISQRDPNIRAILLGDISRIGAKYVLAAQLIDSHTGELVSSELTESADIEGTLPGIRQLAALVRRDLGEGIASSNGKDALDPVTTTSLRAVQLYSEANHRMIVEGPDRPDQIALLRQAVAEDPAFASADLMLAWVLSNSGQVGEAKTYFQRAYDLRNTVSERERLAIVGSYFSLRGSEDIPKAIAVYEELLRSYPDDVWAVRSLVWLYGTSGDTKNWLRMRLVGFEQSPENPKINAGNLWQDLIEYGDREDANRIAKRCDLQPELPACGTFFWQRDAEPMWESLRRGDAAGALAKAELLEARGGAHATTFTEFRANVLAGFYLSAGMLKRAAKADPSTEGAMEIAASRGDAKAARVALTKFLEEPDSTGSVAVLQLIRQGRMREARRVLSELQVKTKLEPLRRPWSVAAQGYYKLAQSNLAGAIIDLREALDLMRARRVHAVWYLPTVADQLAIAFERSGKPDQAFQVLRDSESDLEGWGNGLFASSVNLEARLHLARLCRDRGMVADADRMENELRAQLQLADRDHVIATALRKTPPTVPAEHD